MHAPVAALLPARAGAAQELKMHDATGNDLLEARRHEGENEDKDGGGGSGGDGDDDDKDGNSENDKGNGDGMKAKTSAEKLENGMGKRDGSIPPRPSSSSPVQTHPSDNVVGIMEADAGAGGVQVLLTRGR